MSVFAKLNGKFFKESEICLSANNRSFRYGDGFFETIKVLNGEIVLKEYHLQRIFESLKLLQFDFPSFLTPDYFAEQIIELAKKNNHQKLARIRLTIFRGDGGLYDEVSHYPNHLIQSWALNEASNNFNQNGLVIDVYSEARKVSDKFSPVKSNNYLCYAMAALWAKQQKLNDCLLVNPYGHIADSTIANVFVVKDDKIFTPPLTDGPVNGVMRRHLLFNGEKAGMSFEEKSITPQDLENADEIFLTNAIFGIKWVRQCGNILYENKIAVALYKQFISTLYNS